MKILVTAFKPFNNNKINYSMKVLEYIVGVDKVFLDVLYDESYSFLNNNYNLDDYDFIIALGEARMREALSLEINAKNIASCSIPDNNGVLKKDEIIIDGAKDVLQTKVLFDEIDDIITISLDAGNFVCNNLYYHLLYDYPDKSIFIHVPNLKDDEKEYRRHAAVIMKIINKLKKEN